MSASGNVAGTLALTNAAGSTSTASANLVGITGPNYEPNSTSGNEKVVSFKLAAANAILAGS